MRHPLQIARLKRVAGTDGRRAWYKVTQSDGRPPYGRGSYYLPRGARPGQWHRWGGRLELCVRGFHATQRPGFWLDQQRLRFLKNCRLFVVEVRGCGEMDGRKAVFRYLRFTREVRRGSSEWRRLCRLK